MKSEKKCIDCDCFRERSFFPRTGCTSGKCHDPNSPKYMQWTVGSWGCTPKKSIAHEGELFNF